MQVVEEHLDGDHDQQHAHQAFDRLQSPPAQHSGKKRSAQQDQHGHCPRRQDRSQHQRQRG